MTRKKCNLTEIVITSVTSFTVASFYTRSENLKFIITDNKKISIYLKYLKTNQSIIYLFEWLNEWINK